MKTGCETYQEKLALQALGLIGSQKDQDLDDHLASCADCRQELRDLVKTRDLLGEPEEFAITELEAARLAAGYYQTLLRRSAAPARWKTILWRTAAALTLITLGYGGRDFVPREDREASPVKSPEVQITRLEEVETERPEIRLSPEGMMLIARGRKAVTN